MIYYLIFEVPKSNTHAYAHVLFDKLKNLQENSLHQEQISLEEFFVVVGAHFSTAHES